METLLLNDSFVNQLEDYINNQNYSIGTKIVYIKNLRKIAKQYKELNYDNLLKLHKKLKHPFQRAIFKLINDFCFLKQIPFKISLPSLHRNPRKIPEVLSLNEIRILVDVTPDEYKLLVRSIFGFGAGLRISEGISISWHRFKWNEWLYDESDDISKLSRFKKESERGLGTYVVTGTKRGKSFPVTVPRKLMNEYYDLAKKLDILNEWGIPMTKEPVFDFGLDTFLPELRESNPLFWKNRYIKHSYDYFRYNIVKKLFEPALNKKIHIHMLRHSRASYLLEEGIPLEEIKELLGHEGLETTNIYAKVTLGKIKKSMKNIDTI